MKKTKLFICIFYIFFSMKLSGAMIVQDPAVLALLGSTKLEIVAQTSQIIDSVITLKSQLEEMHTMARNLVDGEITPEMIDFAVKTAIKCGITAPKVILKDFPDLTFNICKEPLPIPKITAIFSFKEGLTIEKKKTIRTNINKLREDSYIWSLTTALATRSHTRVEDIKNFTKQMENKSVGNQVYVGNEIQLTMLNELVEIRKLLALILEGQTIDRANSIDIDQN